jgi:hypothetical protein
VKAGNFAGNTGVGQFAAANTTEERFRAVVSLIDRAMQKGERLAALDISSKAFGPAVTANLLKDSEYLTRMVASADKIAATDIVPNAQIGRALALQAAYDGAVKILEQRWHPIQDLLTAAGIKMHEIWVGIVVSIANAVDWATRLVEKVAEAKIPPQVVSWLNRASQADMENATPDSTRIPETASATDLAAIKAANERTGAVERLTAGLQNQKAVEQAVAQVNAVQNAVWKDTSKNIDDAAKKVSEVRDQYDRAKDAVEKHTARLIADKDAIGLGVGAQEEFRAKAQLVTAAKQAEIPITAALTAEIDKLAKAAGVAGQARAEEAARNKASFDLETVFLSDTEKQIAAVNRQLYGDKWKDYADSAVSNTMRITAVTNDLFKTAQSSGASFSNDLISGLGQGKTAVESLHNAFKNLASTLTSSALKSLFEGDFISAGIKGIAAIGAAIFSANTSTSGDKWLAQQTEGMNARGTDYANRSAMVGVDPNTRAGAIAAQDAKNVQDRIAENKAGGLKMNDLLQLEVKERNQLLKEWDQKDTDILKANADAKLAIEKAAADRALGFQDRLFAATNDFSTLQGQLAAFDRAAGQERIKEAANDNAKLSDLDAATAAERLNVAKTFNEKLAADIAQAAQAAADRSLGFQNRLFAATNDLSTLDGKLAAFDRAALQERAKEAENSVNDIVGLEATQAAERLNIIRDSNAKIVADTEAAARAQQDAINGTAKSTIDYLNGLKSGPNSTASPQDTLTNAQAVYNANLLLAQGGDVGAQGKFPELAENLRKAALAVYASSQGYQDILSQIITQGLALPAVQATTDPVVKAMRDVLAAINAGNATQALDATLSGLIKTAIDAGNAQQIAALLIPKFDTLNTTTDQGLDFAEFVRGLGPSYASLATDSKVANLLTDAQLRAAGINVSGPLTDAQIKGLGLSLEQGNVLNVFKELDGNGNGILERSELIRAASQATATNADSTRISVDANSGVLRKSSTDNNSLLYSAVGNTDSTRVSVDANSNLTRSGNTLLDAIRALQGTATSQLQLLNAGINPSANAVIITYIKENAGTTGAVTDHIAFGDQMLTALYKIVINTWAIAGNTRALYAGTAGGTARDGTFALGGWIRGGTPGVDSVRIIAQQDEFMVNANATRALTQQFGAGVMDIINTGRLPFNDNGRPLNVVAPVFRGGGNADIVAELRANREELKSVKAELAKLQQIVAAGDNMNARATMQSGGDVVDAVKTDTQKTTEQMRMNKRNQRNAA